jgi:hypothetical protein
MMYHASKSVGYQAIPVLLEQRSLVDEMLTLSRRFEKIGGVFGSVMRYGVTRMGDDSMELILSRGRPHSVQFVAVTLESGKLKVVIANIEPEPLSVTVSVSGAGWGSPLMQKQVRSGDTKKFTFELPMQAILAEAMYVKAYISGSVSYDFTFCPGVDEGEEEVIED